MSYLKTQISDVVIDAASDLVGATKAKELAADGLASFGQELDVAGLLEGWFGKLANRVTKTAYVLKAYKARDRKVLRDERDWGAFVQKVYFTSIPDATDNPEYGSPNVSGYTQTSPYDVEGSIGVQALVYGGEGTWTLEFIRPIDQIRSAFLSQSAMDGFIASLMQYAENQIQKQIDAVNTLAINTGLANAIKNGLAHNVLNDYNIAHDDAVLTSEEALRNAEFHRMTAKYISDMVKYMQDYTVLFNAQNYETFTSPEELVVEVLAQYASAANVYLQADTYHNELTALPNYDEISYWQYPGDVNHKFEDCSSINVSHAHFDPENAGTDTVEASGIIAFLRDEEYVASYFNRRRPWEMVNPRDNVVIHGDPVEKGYAVDEFMNAFVIYMQDAGAITATEGSTLKYNHAYAGVENSITVPEGDTPTASGITFTKVGATNEYTFTPATNAPISITVA